MSSCFLGLKPPFGPLYVIYPMAANAGGSQTSCHLIWKEIVFILRQIEGVIPCDGNKCLQSVLASLGSALRASFPCLEFQMQPCCQRASFLQPGLREKILRENWTCFYSITTSWEFGYLQARGEAHLIMDDVDWIGLWNSWILRIQLWWIWLLLIQSSFLSLIILARYTSLPHCLVWATRLALVNGLLTRMWKTMRKKTCLANSLIQEGWEKNMD